MWSNGVPVLEIEDFLTHRKRSGRACILCTRVPGYLTRKIPLLKREHEHDIDTAELRAVISYDPTSGEHRSGTKVLGEDTIRN
eukprot:105246-Rhodomonas_salina.1